MPEPPQTLIVFPINGPEIIKRVKTAIANTKKAEDEVVHSVSIDDASFDTVLIPLTRDENKRRLEERVLGFFSSVHPNKEMREASSEASRLFDDAIVESYLREDVFRLMDAVVQKGEELDTESSHYLQQRHRKYLDYGLKIPAGVERNHFETVRKQMAVLTRTCQKNFNMDSSGLWVKQENLFGVPEDMLRRFKSGESGSDYENQLWHTLKRPEVIATIQNAKNEEIRKAVFIAAETKCSANLEPMKELFLLRHEMANLLGYQSYAAWQLEKNVARTPENVYRFLDDLRERLANTAVSDLQKLLGLKNQDVYSTNSSILHYWDFPYYRARLIKETLGVDQNQISEYFPFQTVLDGILEIFRKLYGVRISQVSDTNTSLGATLKWHEDVMVMEAWDDDDDSFLGYLYLDMYPREFKRPSSGHWRLNQGYTKEDGTRHYPSSAIVFNVTKPAEDKPSLLKHKEVISLFNELGHGVRNLVTKVKFASSHSGYDTDFIVTPSKMLEHWFWDVKQIRSLSKHYSYLSPSYAAAWKSKADNNSSQQPPEKLPESLATGLVSSRFSLEVIENLKLIARSRFALTVHDQTSRTKLESLDLTTLYNSLRDDYTKLCGPSSNGNDQHWAHNQTSFNTVYSHWAAAQYSFLHSSVVAADLFFSGFKGDPTDYDTGRRFRRVVLEPGGGKPQYLLLEEFLGRSPSNEAFIKNLTGEMIEPTIMKNN